MPQAMGKGDEVYYIHAFWNWEKEVLVMVIETEALMGHCPGEMKMKSKRPYVYLLGTWLSSNQKSNVARST